MPVCILGMHRSGTSMVTRLLHLCGLYLGQENDLLDPDSGILNVKKEDNPEGYWENVQFLMLNEEILQVMGGTAYEPPVLTRGWSGDPRLDDLKLRAQDVLRQFEGVACWGWKDPRNTLTIEFWQSLIPDLRVVVCIRNPLEVAESLIQREQGETLAFSLNLWQRYYEKFWDTQADITHLITNYTSYLYDAPGELKRLLDFLDMAVNDEVVDRAIASINPDLYRKALSDRLLEGLEGYPNVKYQYTNYNLQAGAIYQRMMADNDFQKELSGKSSIYLFNQVNSARTQAQYLSSQIKEKDIELGLVKQKAEQALRQAEEQRVIFEEQISLAMLERDMESEVNKAAIKKLEDKLSQFEQQLGVTHETDDVLQKLNSPTLRVAAKLMYRAVVPLRLRTSLKGLRTKLLFR